MTRLLASSLMLLACGGAAADPGAARAGAASVQSRGMVDLATSPGSFGCTPRPIGAGTFPTMRSNAAGSVAWWYCPIAGGGWRVTWAVATTEQLSATNLIAEVRSIVSAGDPNAAFAAAVAKNMKMPVTAPSLTAVWKPFAADMLAGMPPRRAGANGSVTAVPSP